jgi:hypothetical protein
LKPTKRDTIRESTRSFQGLSQTADIVTGNNKCIYMKKQKGLVLVLLGKQIKVGLPIQHSDYVAVKKSWLNQFCKACIRTISIYMCIYILQAPPKSQANSFTENQNN